MGSIGLFTPTSSAAFPRHGSTGLDQQRGADVCAHSWIAFVSPPGAPAGRPGTGGERRTLSQLHVSWGAPRARRAGARDCRPRGHFGRKMTDPQACAGQGKPSLSFSIEEILKKPSASTALSSETRNRSNHAERPPALKAGSAPVFGKYQL